MNEPSQALVDEVAILGALLLDGTAIERVVDILSPHHFHRDKHADIYRAVLRLYRAGEPVDLVQVSAELEKAGVLADVGGRAHLAQIQDECLTAANIEAYARRVRDAALKRRLISVGGDIVALGRDASIEAIDAVQRGEAALFQLAVDRYSNDHINVLDLVTETVKLIEARRAGVRVGAQTGVRDLDALLGGLRAGEV